MDLWKNTFILLKGKAAVMGLGMGAWFKVYSSHYGGTVPEVHDSYLQLYCDAGILGLIAMVLAAIIFIRLSINLLKSSKGNSINWTGIGLIGSIIAGAVFAIFDVTTSITYVSPTGYIYLALPLFWIGVALFAVVHMRREGGAILDRISDNDGTQLNIIYKGQNNLPNNLVSSEQENRLMQRFI